MFYRVGDWNDLQIDLHVSLHIGFKIQFAGIVPFFLELNGITPVILPLDAFHTEGKPFPDSIKEGREVLKFDSAWVIFAMALHKDEVLRSKYEPYLLGKEKRHRRKFSIQ